MRGPLNTPPMGLREARGLLQLSVRPPASARQVSAAGQEALTMSLARVAQIQKAPLQKVGRPEDVAGDIYWLAAGTALITGSVIMLDCGLHLNADA